MRAVSRMAGIAEFIGCDSRNYTVGRCGCSVSKIVVHYTGTDASAHDNLLYFSRSDAAASAHFFIDRDGTICQSVSEEDTAWHAGDWDVNLRSVGIEVVSAGEDFTEEQICSLASLVADLRCRYGIGAEDVIRHYDVTGKLCPAPYVDEDKWAWLHGRICVGGGGWDGGSGGGGEPGCGGWAGGDVDDLARRVIAGEFGNGDARRAALGDSYDAVQARVNEMLGFGGCDDGGGCGDVGDGGGEPGCGGDVDELAWAVIRGEYGNGDERRAALGDAYDAVQARVNELLL